MTFAASAAAQSNELNDRVNRASELLRQGRIDQARSEVARALELAPGDARTRNLRGILEFHDQQFDEALVTYHELVADSPGDAALRLNLGLVYLKLNEIEVAITELNRVLEMRPGHQRALGYLGLAYARRGDFTLARDAFHAANQPALARQMDDSARGIYSAGTLGQNPVGVLGAPPVVADFRTSDLTPPHPSNFGRLDPSAAGREDERERDALAEWADVPSSMSLSPLSESRLIPGNGAFGPGTASGVVVSEHGIPASASSLDSATPGSSSGTSWPLKASDNDVGAGASSPLRQPLGTQPAQMAAVDSPQLQAARAAYLGSGGALGSTATGSAAESGWPTVGLGESNRSSSRLRDFVRSRLVRAEASVGGPRLRVGPGGVLTAQVDRRLFLRIDGVLASIGELAYEPACRRIRGRMVPELLGGDDRPVYCVGGRGLLVIGWGTSGVPFQILELKDETLYVREDILWGFEETLHWENGRVPRAPELPLVQFRGDGKIALRMGPLAVCVPVSTGEVLYCDSRRLLGWQGKVVPRAVDAATVATADGAGPAPFIECIGEGIVLVDNPEAAFAVDPPRVEVASFDAAGSVTT